MTKTDLLEPRPDPQEVDKAILHIFSFGDHKLSLVPIFSVLAFMIMPWDLPFVDLGALNLRGIQMIFLPAEARSKNQLGGEMCIPAEITFVFPFPPHLLHALFLLHYA